MNGAAIAYEGISLDDHLLIAVLPPHCYAFKLRPSGRVPTYAMHRPRLGNGIHKHDAHDPSNFDVNAPQPQCPIVTLRCVLNRS